MSFVRKSAVIRIPFRRRSCEEIEMGRLRRSVRRSARSTQVERALRARFRCGAELLWDCSDPILSCLHGKRNAAQQLIEIAASSS